MATDNKKISDLTSESDEDTSELPVLSEAVAALPEEEYEADAATQSFESLRARNKPGTESVAALKSDLRERDASINQLQYDIEQLRSRWTGLEKELKAREQLTDNVAAELEDHKRRLRDTTEQLRKRERRLADLEAKLHQQESRLTEADTRIEAARNDAESLESAFADLQTRSAAETKSIESLRADLSEEKARRKWAEEAERAFGDKVSLLESQRSDTLSLVASLQHYIEGRKSRWEKQQAELSSREALLGDLQKNVNRLTRDINDVTDRLHQSLAAKEKAEQGLATAEKDNARYRTEALELKRGIAGKETSLTGLSQEVEKLQANLQITAAALEQAESKAAQVQAEFDRLQSESLAMRAELSELAEKSLQKDALLRSQEQNVADLNGKVSAAQSHLQHELAQSKLLESQVGELQTQCEQLEQASSALQQVNTAHEATLHARQLELVAVTSKLDETAAELHIERDCRQQVEDKLQALETEAQTLRSRVTELGDAASEASALKESNARLAGLTASNEAQIREIREQLAKTENYADTLRIKLQNQLADSNAQTTDHDKLQKELAVALQRIDTLSGNLETEKQKNAALETGIADNQQRVEEELRKARFELGEAQETLTESESLNGQLTADLIDSKGFRQALETRLAEADKTRQAEINDLSKQLGQLKRHIDDYERKVSHKDAAINALLSELATKSVVVEPESGQAEHEAEDVVQRLGERKAPVTEDRSTPDRERVTRLLIGNIDGQELRFPLFKDRLTVGRTTHNDIQIKAQYISRRHAVLVTEDDRTRIVDWGSKNGVYVNGIRVTEKSLRNGDRVTVGTAEFRFEERPKR
ncbi:MAG: FHA domain-containing protein [Woeseia sp.]